MARVELDAVGKRYPNGFEAVRGIDLDVADGEFIVLVGPSGCGKSTTLRMVAGLESISTGELRIDGARVNERSPRERGVAMVFQSYALYPHMTVFENMAFSLTLQKTPKAEIRARVQEVAERLDIGHLLDRKPGQMSGGQRQRVAMGRAIIRRPKVFLFDEPLSNLDAKLRLKMRVEVGRLHRSLGATSLYVTHDQVEAMTLADRIVLLDGGVVQQVGPPLELFERPANLFTATFIGSPTMNVLDGTVAQDRIEGPGFSIPAPPTAALTTGDAVKIGVRPHRLSLGEAGLPALVELVEPMGAETYVHCRSEVGTVVVRVAGAGPALGAQVRVALPAEGAHLFAADDGRRL